MDTAEDPAELVQQWDAPIFPSLRRPILTLGIRRIYIPVELGGGVVVSALQGNSPQGVLSALLSVVVVHTLLFAMTAREPQAIPMYLRALRYLSFYPARRSARPRRRWL